MDFVIRFVNIDPQEITQRLCRNPAYNDDHVSLNNWCLLPLPPSLKPKLQAAIEESIAKEGMRNPIVAYALPEGVFLIFGGSRLRAAHNLGLLTMPVIVNDYTGRFASYPEVTPDNWQTFFTDVPQFFEFGEFGFDTHYSLERMRRDSYDSAGFAWTEPDAEFLKAEFPWLSDT